MKIPDFKGNVVASDIAPERLANNPQLTEQQKIGEASRQFEAIMVKQILDSAQKSAIKSKYSDENSTSSGIYHDMVTTRLADSISKTGAFGFAKTFEQQLNHPAHPAASAAKTGHETESPAPTHSHHPHAHDQTEVKKAISAGAHSAVHTLKPLHERTLTKSH